MIPLLQSLFVQTIVAPAQAAQHLARLKLPSQALWSLLAIACILNAIGYFLSLRLFPIGDEFYVPFANAPGVVFVVLFFVMTVSVFAMFLTGRALGGKGSLESILLLMSWLQFVRLAVQIIAWVLMAVLPEFAALFVLAAGLYGVWILVNFVKVAHEFDAIGKAVITLVLTLMGMTMGLSVVLSVIDVAAVGIN